LINQNKAIDNPLLRSGLYLNNAGDVVDQAKISSSGQVGEGVLTAYEAMNLNLNATDLVVLSACETGRGEVQVGEGVYGLQRAFQIAGAKAVIMSLFKVSDSATQELMNIFYRNWISKGMDKRKAFIEAKKEMMKTKPQPLYWGSFVMVGVG
jgi:CHAT domain-containing protein